MLDSSLIMPGGAHWPSIIKAEASTFNASKIFTPKDHLHLSLPHQKAWLLLARTTLNPVSYPTPFFLP
jgi:hypothetical protein